MTKRELEHGRRHGGGRNDAGAQVLVGLKLPQIRGILGRELAHAESQGPSYSDFLAACCARSTYPWELQPSIRKAVLFQLASLTTVRIRSEAPTGSKFSAGSGGPGRDEGGRPEGWALGRGSTARASAGGGAC